MRFKFEHLIVVTDQFDFYIKSRELLIDAMIILEEGGSAKERFKVHQKL